jgi:general secretion pathway protein A
MFLNYYNLIEQPFGVNPDPRFLYLGATHREALASLVYGTHTDRGFLAMIAKPGMGKTSLLFHYLQSLRDKARTAFVFRTDCNSREFIRHILLDLGIDVPGTDLPGMHDALNRLLTEEIRGGRRFVLVIDEAQNMQEEVLESIRLLSNFETPWTKLMLIVLAGQPQLADRLASPSMTQLRQRISMVIRIEPFTHDDVNAYINRRLCVAGCHNPSLFTVGARKMIAAHSEGIPRNINNLCFNAMSLACALKQKAIDRDAVLQVIADLDLEPLREKPIAAKKSEEVTERATPLFSSGPRKQPLFDGWTRRLAFASALLLTLSWAVVQANRGGPRATKVAASAVTAPASPSVVPTRPADLASPVIKRADDSIRVMPGQTLTQISIERYGKYNGEVLEDLRGLNPWLSDPDRIQSGQKIRISSARIVPGDVQRGAEQTSYALPAEVGKQ